MYFEEGLAKCMDNFRDQKKVLDPPEPELHGAVWHGFWEPNSGL